MDYIWLVATMTAGFTFLASMATGAFFSRPAGTKLGGAGVAVSAVAIVAGIQFGLPWWLLAAPIVLLVLNGFLGVAALGGEE